MRKTPQLSRASIAILYLCRRKVPLLITLMSLRLAERERAKLKTRQATGLSGLHNQIVEKLVAFARFASEV